MTPKKNSKKPLDMSRPRYLDSAVRLDLPRKMVLIGGPRQAGKTTFAMSFLKNTRGQHPAYFNWDFVKDRKPILGGEFPPNEPLIILDEVHKYTRWRNLLKGFFDKLHDEHSFIVTGSARLDHYRKGGDSMLGRTRYFRLHPFSLREMNPSPSASDLDHLFHFGGFPEPLFRGNDRELRLWQLERREKIVKEDVRDLENVKELALIELLADALSSRVGAPLSVKNLREDLQVAHETAERWIQILENLFYCFRISPYGSPKLKAVKKERKLYLWDHAEVSAEGGFRFENLVANQLLKYCHYLQDCEGHRMDLKFIRDIDKHEVDFVVEKNGKALFAVECKTGEKQISRSIKYFAERTLIPQFYQIHRGEKNFTAPDIRCRVLPFTTFCQELDMP